MESNEVKEEKKIEVNFTAKATSKFAGFLAAVGYSDFLKYAKTPEDLKDEKKQNEMLKTMMITVFKGRGQAEEELNGFLTAVTGITNISSMHFKEAEKIEAAVFGHEEFKDFFMSAQRSVLRLFAGLR